MKSVSDRQIFENRLDRSQAAVDRGADWLRKQGYDVIVPPIRKDRPDKHDIWVIHPERFNVEVKHRYRLNFTGLDDFPWNTILVCAKETWDWRSEKPRWFLNFNKPMTCFVFIDAIKTRQHWTIKKAVQDCDYKTCQDDFQCPIDLVEFHRYEGHPPNLEELTF